MTFIKVYSSAKYNKFFNVLILTVSNIFYAFINPLKTKLSLIKWINYLYSEFSKYLIIESIFIE